MPNERKDDETENGTSAETANMGLPGDLRDSEGQSKIDDDNHQVSPDFLPTVPEEQERSEEPEDRPLGSHGGALGVCELPYEHRAAEGASCVEQEEEQTSDALGGCPHREEG